MGNCSTKPAAKANEVENAPPTLSACEQHIEVRPVVIENLYGCFYTLVVILFARITDACTFSACQKFSIRGSAHCHHFLKTGPRGKLFEAPDAGKVTRNTLFPANL